MKILLFSRNDLANLYGEISRQLKSEYDFIHLAYSEKEESVLRKVYGVDHPVNFKEEIKHLYSQEKLDYDLLKVIDEEIILYSKGRFCLNSAIQSDRTFAYLTYEEAMLMCQVYYKFWDKLMEKEGFQIMLHEPVALFFLQIASILSAKYNVQYLTQINVFGEDKYNWIFVSAENGFPVELPYHLNKKDLSKSEIERAMAFLSTFRKDYNLIFPKLASKNDQLSVFGFLKKTARLILKAGFKNRKKQLDSLDKEAVNHIENYSFFHKENTLDRIRILFDKTYRLNFDEFDASLNYYYYPMHMEPEAVVLYWGEGLYKNQIKLIENIAAQLPLNTYLYVKVHPIVKEERFLIDYMRLKAIPNIKLLGPSVPGKQIISGAKGVMTINGTSGFEGVLLNKPVFVFGNSFYDLSDRVIKINHIKDLREKIYAIKDKSFEDDEMLFSFINAYLSTSKKGFTAYYLDYVKRLGVEHNDNVKNISKGIISSFNYIVNNSLNAF